MNLEIYAAVRGALAARAMANVWRHDANVEQLVVVFARLERRRRALRAFRRATGIGAKFAQFSCSACVRRCWSLQATVGSRLAPPAPAFRDGRRSAALDAQKPLTSPSAVAGPPPPQPACGRRPQFAKLARVAGAAAA